MDTSNPLGMEIGSFQMREVIIQVSNDYNDGMLTDREYLARLVSEIGKVWSDAGDTGNKDAEWLATRLQVAG